MLSALVQKTLADRLPAWAPEPEQPLGSQQSVEMVMLATQPLARPWETAGKPVTELVGLTTAAPAWVCCGNPCIHYRCLASPRHSCQQVPRRQGRLRWSCHPEHHFQTRMSVVSAHCHFPSFCDCWRCFLRQSYRMGWQGPLPGCTTSGAQKHGLLGAGRLQPLLCAIPRMRAHRPRRQPGWSSARCWSRCCDPYAHAVWVC